MLPRPVLPTVALLRRNMFVRISQSNLANLSPSKSAIKSPSKFARSSPPRSVSPSHKQPLSASSSASQSSRQPVSQTSKSSVSLHPLPRAPPHQDSWRGSLVVRCKSSNALQSRRQNVNPALVNLV